ncbi:hypothetical protein K435DRAFT_803424 [Dendrothele bispora CBS 962.96]|uniref:Uncharacterized protein n=1 Tax=Dendrothele bispora (strain CBS 962.96) TaxID=1314807 RepID=A0A4S8LIB3_DENBC|nr:hypothetical protein K435DRAFT_803424 [Dendrothele bispora CBS 962.96]
MEVKSTHIGYNNKQSRNWKHTVTMEDPVKKEFDSNGRCQKLCGSAPARTTGKIKCMDQLNVPVWIPIEHSGLDCALRFFLSFLLSVSPPFLGMGSTRVSEVDTTKKRTPTSGVKSSALGVKASTKDKEEGLELQTTQSGKLDKIEWMGSRFDVDADVLPVVVDKRRLKPSRHHERISRRRMIDDRIDEAVIDSKYEAQAQQ